MHCGIVAFDIIPVAVLHVEVDQVDKAQAVKVTVHDLYRLLDAVCVALCGIGFGKAPSCKEVIDLTYGYYVIAFAL